MREFLNLGIAFGGAGLGVPCGGPMAVLSLPPDTMLALKWACYLIRRLRVYTDADERVRWRLRSESAVSNLALTEVKLDGLMTAIHPKDVVKVEVLFGMHGRIQVKMMPTLHGFPVAVTFTDDELLDSGNLEEDLKGDHRNLMIGPATMTALAPEQLPGGESEVNWRNLFAVLGASGTIPLPDAKRLAALDKEFDPEKP